MRLRYRMSRESRRTLRLMALRLNRQKYQFKMAMSNPKWQPSNVIPNSMEVMQ